MNDVAAFKATYADLKLVKTRGVLQIIFEAPVEKDSEIMTVLGGMPRAAEERWFAIARLNIDGAATRNHLPKTTPPTEGAARHSLSQRAAFHCTNPQFRLFLERTYLPANNHCNSADEAAEMVRLLCGVESRADIKPGTEAADKFDHLEAKFMLWKNADRYVES